MVSIFTKIGNINCDTRHMDFVTSLKNSFDGIISFSGIYKSYCVCIVDIVNSSKITAHLQKSQMCRYYSIFLNSMAFMAKEFGAQVVKNIGDSLLYYFPETVNTTNKLSFVDAIECGMTMIDARDTINTKLQEESLPSISYRISADYGMIMIAKSKNSSNEDIFGSTVNICAKINRKANPNSMVIGSDLYEIVTPLDGYGFKSVTSYSAGLKLEYPVYSISRHKS